MRHLVALPVVAATLAFAGCAGQNSVTTSAPSAAQLASFVAEVQSYASTACAFEPTADTIAKIATSGSISASATEELASSIASKICASVSAKGARYGRLGAPHVGRVAVHGTFKSSGRHI